MDAAGWLACFETRAQAWRRERAAMHLEVGARIRAELSPPLAPAPAPVVFDTEVFDDEQMGLAALEVPVATARALRVALSTGWAAWTVRARAALPARGLIVSWSLRARRHDERVAAVWVNGHFDCAFYVGPGGLERLSAAKAKGRRTLLDALGGVRLASSSEIPSAPAALGGQTTNQDQEQS